MSHFLTVPINANGIIIDPNIDVEIQFAAVRPFRFTEVFIYSHGWWTTGTDAMSTYNIFSIGFAKTLQALFASAPATLPRMPPTFSALAMALHWPSTISEDQNSVSNFFEALTFFTMEHRADDVGQHAGYSLLRLLIEARQGEPPLRFNLIGHSFGARVLCSALQALAGDAATLAKAAAIGAEFNVVLLQAATDADSLGTGGLYDRVLSGIPNLRLLITTSMNDTALHTWYPAAQGLAHLFKNPQRALGAAGPTGLPAAWVPQQLSVEKPPVQQPAGNLTVADLTPLHVDHAPAWGNQWGGQHSDIDLPEIYELLTRFFWG